MITTIIAILTVYFVSVGAKLYLLHSSEFRCLELEKKSPNYQFDVTDFKLGKISKYDPIANEITLTSARSLIDYTVYIHENVHRHQPKIWNLLKLIEFELVEYLREKLHPYVFQILEIILFPFLLLPFKITTYLMEFRTYKLTMKECKSKGILKKSVRLYHSLSLFSYRIELVWNIVYLYLLYYVIY